MKLHERQQAMSLAGTELEIKLHEYWDDHKIENYEECLRALTFEMRNILLDMEPKVERAETFSNLKDMIRAHQQEKGMTDIEVLQALTSHMADSLKFMLRMARHGNYDKPGGEA